MALPDTAAGYERPCRIRMALPAFAP